MEEAGVLAAGEVMVVSLGWGCLGKLVFLGASSPSSGEVSSKG